MKKYKPLSFLNTDNFISIKSENNFNLKTQPIKINYLFSRRVNIIKNFIYFYSISLLLNPFSPLIFQSNLEFKLKINSYFILLLENNYSNFFY